MSFDIPQIHIPDNSPEAQAVELVMGWEHVSPQEAVLSILRRSLSPKKNPAQRMIGLFSSDEDAAIMDEVMELIVKAGEPRAYNAGHLEAMSCAGINPSARELAGSVIPEAIRDVVTSTATDTIGLNVRKDIHAS